MDATIHALNRFGLGARPGEARTIHDPRNWLRQQLAEPVPADGIPHGAADDAIVDAIRDFRQVRDGDRQQRQLARRRLVDIAASEARAAIRARVTTTRPFVERLVMFWSNHLCVSAAAKVLVAPLAGSYERDVIRPHVLGRFDDMVLASAKHPAMLIYLDNFQSIGPGSRAAQMARRQQRSRGLNENYARELLELHTLGVNGGYTQQDVQELARVLTGWTIGLQVAGGGGLTRARRGFQQASAPRTAGFLEFAFQPALHEPGARTVLGTRYADAGVEQGERVIRALCGHSSTARFVASKLVAHFVADDPPADAVSAIARVFRDTKGDLAAVSRALIDIPDAWSGKTRKFRTPQDWMIAALRAFEVRDVSDLMVASLRQLRHPLWGPQAPKGFGDTTQEWADPDSLLNRAELARTFVRRVGAGDDPRALLDVIDVGSGDPLRALLADTSVPAADRFALGIAGPAFQWR